MAFGLVGDSGSAILNAEMLGGIVTGSDGEFIALPISSTQLGGLSNLNTNEWSRFYLSDSFGAASSSIIQALNYLSASIGDGGGGSIAFQSGSTTVNTVSNVNTSLLGLIQDLGGGSIAITGAIGYPEDGTYTDGLYTDFTPSTPIGTAVDKFNEIFKILAPTPAPALARINFISDTGVAAKLSFGASQAVAGYTQSATAAGFLAADINETYQNITSGTNFRIGVLDGTQHVTGTLNFTTGPSLVNGNLAFNSGAFGNAESGDLKLELNGTVIHTTNMANVTGTGQPATGTFVDVTNNSGFIDYSLSASSFDGNGSEWYIFQHRTAKYKVDAADQKIGWNYARVVHTFGGTDYATNYVEWVNDPSGSTNDLAIAIPRIENITLIGSKFLSGVEYNTDVTGNYKADILNVYRNVYAASGTPISFTVANSSAPSAQAVPAISVGSETNEKILGVTASLDYNGNSLLNGAITCNTSVTHPLKNTISNTGSATTGNGFLIDNRSLASSNLSEKFHDEAFRKVSGNFDTQASVTNASSIWNSQHHMTGGGATGHTDGLLYFNQRLYSPKDDDIPNNGNFLALSNTAPDEPNYSGITGQRTFFRVLSNSSGGEEYDLKITSTKVGTTYNNSSLGSSNAQFYVKIPGTTGWMDISQDFVYGSILDGNGALIAEASNDTDSGNNIHHVTFGTASVANNNHVMIKLLADASWEGYLSQLDFQLGASTQTPTEAPQLDDIDCDNTGQAAKLSFGSSRAITNYTSSAGAGIGLTTFDLNENYTVSGDRRGIFSSLPTITGTLNEDVSSNGNNYPANAFKDAYEGTLVLEVNGNEIHEVDLNSTLNVIADNFNSNGSGFNLGHVGFSTTTDNIPSYIKPYRTGSFKVATADQVNGWNYARVKHNTGGGSVETNYVEWIVDVSGSTNDTSVNTPTLSNFDHPDFYSQSGIRYFSDRPSASFDFEASNFYRNVYYNGSDGISFGTTTNCSISNIRSSGSGIHTTSSAASQLAMPLQKAVADGQELEIQVTGTVLFDDLTSLSGGLGLFTARSVAVASTVKHVSGFKSNRTTSTAEKEAFMVYSGSDGSTSEADNEYFNTEAYRIVSGNYTTQNSLTDSGNKWNSSTAMNNGGTHDDGMVTVNGYLISPFQIGNSGDVRSVGDGGSLQAPANNPNYSSLTNATRTFYRYYFNNTVNDRPSVTVTLYGSGSLVKKATSLDSQGKFYVEVKIPGKTAWLDLGTSYTSNNPNTDGAGALDGAAPGNPAIDISTGGTSVVCNFNGESLLGGANDEKFAIKVSAHKDWIGYLSRVQIAYS
tara:strand:- start:2730 stop:6629 length:3900 start_codon:yes stop_codon:yes gene_type:complete